MAPIFLIVGAPAVGKSSAARALAARFPKSVHIPVDTVREMVVSGLVLPGEWNEGLIEQLRLARESVTHMARAYAQAGFTVVIDDFWDPFSQMREYDALFSEPQVRKVLLYPSQHAAEARGMQREGAGAGGEYIAGGIRLVYGYLRDQAAGLEEKGWLLLDTTDTDVDTTVSAILKQSVTSQP